MSRRVSWLLLLAGCLYAIGPAASPAADAPDATASPAQRFLAARQALKTGKQGKYARLRATLDDYPLWSYLDYFALSARLSSVSHAEVDAFFQAMEGQLLADRLRKRWLDLLARRRDWKALQRYYREDLADIDLQCQYQLARLDSGYRDEALQATSKLWLSGESRPSSCDPLFKLWYDSGEPDPELAWQRFLLAMAAEQLRLARYLQRYLDPTRNTAAQQWLRLHAKPTELRKVAHYAKQDADLLEHGFRRLARREPQSAARLFGQYRASLTPTAASTLHQYIVSHLAAKDPAAALEWSLDQDSSTTSASLFELRARLAISQLRWEIVRQSIGALPEDQRLTPRWRYWQSRSEQQLAAGQLSDDGREQLQALAEQRNFYGFLAADLLDQPYAMQDRPAVIDRSLPTRIAALPAIERARELYRLKLLTDARREWRSASRGMSTEELIASAILASDWGWHHQAIFAMIGAEYWDDLQIRFPLAYADTLLAAARVNQLEPSLVFAIARQESAFGSDARSPAGAMGLMQLMPTTARQTALRQGIAYAGSQDLLDPAANAALGSRYMGSLLEDFTGNRILAAAAYNAGPRRVRQWLQRLPAAVEADIFIESIPFRETRSYVQNVLAFAVIYGYRLGEELVLLRPTEQLIDPHGGKLTDQTMNLLGQSHDAG